MLVCSICLEVYRIYCVDAVCAYIVLEVEKAHCFIFRAEKTQHFWSHIIKIERFRHFYPGISLLPWISPWKRQTVKQWFRVPGSLLSTNNYFTCSTTEQLKFTENEIA